MKICLLGPGIMDIPPSGWGAVEILIWDYYCELKDQGHDISIINKIRSNHHEQSQPKSQYCVDLITEINNGNYDFIHIHYDVLFHIADKLTCPKIGITSHYPYINNEHKCRQDGFTNIFTFMLTNKRYINFMLAQKDADYLINKGANPGLIKKLENGINSSVFNITSEPSLSHKTLYLGKIDDRKSQCKYQTIDCIDFVGPIACNKFNKNINYLGSWTRDQVHKNVTEYGNMLLLSQGEADPLVVKEALVCGLGVVLNESSGKNLENKDFITIIPDMEINNIDYVKNQIELNRSICLNKRDEIIDFGKKYSMNKICNVYVGNLNLI